MVYDARHGVENVVNSAGDDRACLPGCKNRGAEFWTSVYNETPMALAAASKLLALAKHFFFPATIFFSSSPLGILSGLGRFHQVVEAFVLSRIPHSTNFLSL